MSSQGIEWLDEEAILDAVLLLQGSMPETLSGLSTSTPSAISPTWPQFHITTTATLCPWLRGCLISTVCVLGWKRILADKSVRPALDHVREIKGGVLGTGKGLP